MRVHKTIHHDVCGADEELQQIPVPNPAFLNCYGRALIRATDARSYTFASYGTYTNMFQHITVVAQVGLESSSFDAPTSFYPSISYRERPLL